MADERYYFDRDDSGHWYLVPLEFKDEFNAWLSIPEEESDGCSPPFVTTLGRSLSNWSFSEPREEATDAN